MFRGFRATSSRGRTEYRFQWLTRVPTHARFDAGRGVLTFPSLLPAVATSPGLVPMLKGMVADRSTKAVPEHKRVDARKARLSATISKGDLTLAIAIRGRNHEYAVKHALNLVNEMFVTLHEHAPEYLAQHFGISTE